MRKNRLMWNIALILVIIVAIPIAYAQAFTGSSWFFILINSAIVGVILFLLQSFLIPGKDNKEKTAVWVAIIAGTLLIGFFFGRSGFIWEHPVFARFFSVYVLVNAIVIGAVLYFVLGFILKDKIPKSPEGMGGYGILIFLIALIFAVQIGNQWIWQQNVVKQLVDYLFGAQGILNPKPPEYRLWAFITVTTLLAFFFQGYLLQGVAGGTKINYALAILIGSSVARAGISFQSIVLLGEAIFTIVLAKALKGTAPEPKGIPGHWILAGFLVGWASAAMTYGTEYQGWLATFVGYPLWKLGLLTVGPTGAPAQPTGVGGWVSWIGKMGLGALLIIGLPILLFGFVIGRGERRTKMLREGITRIWDQILKRLKMTEWGAKLFGDLIEKRSPTLPGELPLILKDPLGRIDLRVELFNFFNLLLRYEIYSFKKGRIEKLRDDIKKDEGGLVTNILTKEDIFASMKGFIEGSPMALQQVTGVQGTKVWKVWVQGTKGFASQHILIHNLIQTLKPLLEGDLTIPTAEKGEDIRAWAGIFRDKVLEPQKVAIYGTSTKAAIYQVENDAGRFQQAVKRFGIYNKIRSHRLFFLDMYNLYGTYLRGYNFPKPDAVPDLYTYTTADDVPGILKKIASKTKRGSVFAPARLALYNLLKNKPLSQLTPQEEQELNAMKVELRKYNFVPGTSYLEEADIFGFSISDQNRITIEGKRGIRIGVQNYIRRWRRKDLQELHMEKKESTGFFPRFHTLVDMATKEWDFYVSDMQRGNLHPFSKSIVDYSFVQTGSLDFDKARFKTPLTKEGIAFDREALRNPSKMFGYWGKKNYFDDQIDSVIQDPVNPYPVASLTGLWKFILDVAEKHIKEPEEFEKFRETFKMEFVELSKLVSEKKEK